MAWRIPPVWNVLREKTLPLPEGSSVPPKQANLQAATNEVLQAIAADIRGGLLETVGVEGSLIIDKERCSMILELPAATDTEMIARAIDAENVEAWCDDAGRVHIAVNPWFSTKDIDQTVLCTIKVIHVLLGMHAVCEIKPPTFSQKLISSVMEIMLAQKKAANKDN